MVAPTPQEIIRVLYAGGGRVKFESDPPTLLVPKAHKKTLDAHRDLLRATVDLREAGRRAAIFRGQVARWVRSRRIVAPVLALPGAATIAGPCVSCGDDLLYGDWRCGTCTLAVYEALRTADPDGATS